MAAALWGRSFIGASRLGYRQIFLPLIIAGCDAERGQRSFRVEELGSIQSRTDPGPRLSEFRLYVPFPADQQTGGNIELVLRNRQLGVSIVGQKPLADYIVAVVPPNLLSPYSRR